MKFIVSSSALYAHLQGISRVINSKNALPILDCFLFELRDEALNVTVSDSETTMVTTVEVVESNADGRFAIAARTLLDALKEIPEQPLTFDIDLQTLELNIQYQNGQYNLMGQNADEFPTPATLSDNAVRVEIDAQVLMNGINRAIFATADDELRPVMNGIYFDITTEGITLVASDGHKLVRSKTTAAHGNERAAFILPKKPALLLKNILPKESGQVTIEFDDRTVVDILTPRVEVEAIEKGTPMEKVLSVYRETGYTRLPVYVDSIDNVVGVINEKDFLNLYLDGAGSFDPIITPVVCATPRMKISVLLRRLQKEKSHLAVVVDEFGGTMGVVTMEDIIEELVGEIWDEHDEVVENFAKVDEGRYFVQGEVTLADFFEYFGIGKDPSEFETVTLGGLIAQLAGKVPAVGEEVKFENLTLKVLSVEYYKVTQAEVTVSATQESA